MRKNCFKIFLLIHFLLIWEGAFGRNIHLLYVMNSQEVGLKADIQSIKAQLNGVVHNIKLGLKANLFNYDVSGTHFTTENFYDTVEKMPIAPLEDIVILCVLSHGNHADAQHEYPTIQFNAKTNRHFSEMMNLVLAKRPAYLISIVNVCNTKVNQTGALKAMVQVNNNPFTGKSIHGNPYLKLFSKRANPLAITYLSSQVGSLTRTNGKGGKAFVALIESFQYWTSQQAESLPTWENILFQAQVRTIAQVQKSVLQCPYMEIVEIAVKNGQIARKGTGLQLCEE
jgi:hypothetical protein